MFKRTKVSSGVLLALGGALLAPVTTAIAQQEAQRIEITGSSIKRIAAEGALPVQIITQADIQRSGVTSVTQLIQNIPVMSGFTALADSVGGSGGGITTAGLHGVGEQYTLVLLNGRRVAPADSGTTIDLNSIPLTAIERVEVLTDGASALYGADAIAGVVNFILKRGEAPFTVEVSARVPGNGGAEEGHVNISKGFGDLSRDGYSLFVAGSYDKVKQLRAADRSFAKTGIISQPYPGGFIDFFNGSSRSVPPNVDVRGTAIGGVRADGSTINSISFSPYRETTGNCPPAHVAIGRQCFFDYTSTVEISPEQERKAIYGSGKLALGKSNWNLFGDLAYTDVSTIARIAPYPAEFLMDNTHPYFAQYITPNLTPEQQAVATSANVKYRLFDMGGRGYDYNTKALHSVLGVEGAAAGWDLTTAFTISQQTQDQNYVSGFPLAAAFTAGLNAQLFDPFPYAAGEMPADQLAALKATQYIGNYNTTDIKMVAWDGNAQRPLFSLGGGSAILSVGADVRKMGYQVTANPAVANAEILFDDPQPEYDLERKTFGVYGELLMPISKTFEMTAGIRYDSISGVTDNLTGSKFGDTETAGTFKLAGKWQPVRDVALRASFGTGFRTATMRQIAQPRVDFGVTSGTYDCPFNTGYDPLGFFAAGHICADGLQFEVFQGGNPDLKPEKSKQWNIGGVVQASNQLSIGLNYWSVDIKDSVSSVSEQLIMQNPATYLSLFTTKTKASNGLTYVAILDAPINIGRVENRGIDWDLTYKDRMSFGRFEGKIAGTYMIKARYTVPGTNDQWTTSLGKFGVDEAVTLRNRINASGTLGVGNWEHTLTMNYRSGYLDQPWSADDCFFLDANGDCKADVLSVPERITFDWRTQWMPTKNLTLVFGIENVFDEDPPLQLRVNGAGHQLGYDPRYNSPLGRTYNVAVKYQF